MQQPKKPYVTPAKTTTRPPAQRRQGNSPAPKRQKNRGKAVLMNILRIGFVFACIAVIIVSIMAVQVVKYVVDTTKDDDIMLDLLSLSQPQKGYIWTQDSATGDWTVYQELKGVSNSIWAPLSELPQSLIDAAISTEDKDFYSHKGFMFMRTMYAGLNEVFHFRSRFGASTLDQQLVKNITGDKQTTDEYGNNTVGYQRKAREIFRAVGINNIYSKDTILEAYINTMPLTGSIVGAPAGAKEYFNKNVGELTLAESAMIVGITNYPGKYNPYKNGEACLVRRNDVLFFMRGEDKITEEEYRAALQEPLGLYTGEREIATAATKQVNSYFTDVIFESVVQDLQDNGQVSSREAAVFMYYNGGLNIYATADVALQSEMERIYTLGYGEGGLFPESVTVETEVKSEDGTLQMQTVHPQSAMVVMDYEGALRGVVGGIGEKNADLVLNRATQSARPVGSTMKPIAAYALGLEYGLIDFSSKVMDAPILSRDPSNPVRDPETGEIIFTWPFNYGENTGNNVPVLVSDAVAKSLNTVPAAIGNMLGVESMYEFLADTLQISTLVSEGSSNDKSLAPLVLGSLTKGMSAYELAAAYAMVGNGGIYSKPYCYTHVTDKMGNLVMESTRVTVQAVSAETSYILNRLLSTVLRGSTGSAGGGVSGTASGMALGYLDSVAKTGTTTDDKDRWFVGLTPYYVSAVWWGYDSNEEIKWSPSAKTNPPPLVWKTVMEAAQANLPEKTFPERPAGVEEHKFCRDTGLLASPNCPNLQTGYYIREILPDVCPDHP